MHRRKSSKGEQDDVPVISVSEASPSSLRPTTLNGVPTDDNSTGRVGGGGVGEELSSFSFGSSRTTAAVNGHSGWGNLSQSQRSRVASVPAVSSPLHDQFPTSQSHPPNPPSAGPYRTSFTTSRASQSGINTLHGPNGSRHPQAPAMRQSLSLPSSHNSHSRTRSVSGPFSPSTPSPLATSFPIPQSISYPPPGLASGSSTVVIGSPPKGRGLSNGNGVPSTSVSNSPAHTRRHSRLHSRNLSIFFPRPGSLPVTAIDEDGAQEVDFSSSPSYSSTYSSDDGVLMPSSSSPAPGQRSFREGFKFGARPPGSTSDQEAAPDASQTTRRGHHHKHSLSHNFFSFLEPGGGYEDLHTQPTLTPVSPWNPISPFPVQKSSSIHTQVDYTYPADSMKGHGLGVIQRDDSPTAHPRAPPEIDTTAFAMAIVQFVLGASLWVAGQQIGSLSCTGLGYWVVFDSFGVCLGHVLPGYVAKLESKSGNQWSYGNSRLETLALYAQAVYLLFASVYVCKETVEHILLSAGEGHHHHHGDEVTDIFGIDFPPYLLCITLLSLIGTATIFNNQSKVVSATGNHIPPVLSFVPTRFRHSMSHYTYPPILANLLSNPYALAPLCFCTAILCALSVLPSYQHRSFDLMLAAIETIVTFSLAYPAAVALGAVLLQTAPPRGLPGGRMETFLRAMREIERHDKVLHLPAPHIWQLTPYFARPESVRSLNDFDGPSQSLVVTLELHVPQSLSDDEVLELTAWAWDRCKTALKYGTRDGGGEGEAEVTIGVVRG
ncbi:hypothetical protein BC835DRAFT_1078291 [Cytidiella melzeri]|nr:hypothetical protein BC835DRAFT_1078291 [Cytidiella melzeri]